MANVQKIAVTGGIGAGKSMAMSVLKKAGYFTVSCDDVTKDLYGKRFVKKGLKKLFPSAVNGCFKLSVDKQKIAEQIFSDEGKKKALEDFLHPLIMREVENRLNTAKTTLAFAEVPLLFEGGYQNLFDGVIVIMRPLEKRIESVKARSGLTAEQIIERIKSQTNYDELDTSDYVVIQNNGNEIEFSAKILSNLKVFNK